MEKLSVSSVASVLQVSVDTVRRLCEQGELSSERTGGKRGWIRIYESSLREYAERHGIRVDWSELRTK